MKSEQIENIEILDAGSAAPEAGTCDDSQTNQRLLEKIRILETRIAQLESLESERQQVEKALIKALQEWETTFNAANDSIMLVDNEFKIIEANPASSRLFDKPLGSILGKNCHHLLYGTAEPPDDCLLKTARQTGKHQEGEFRIRQSDTWVTASADPVFDDEGNLTRIVHIVKDITERKKAEQVLEKLNHDLDSTVRELKRSNDELRSFAHVIAHDLKSPLRGIGALADWILRQCSDKLDEQGVKRLNLLIRRVKRLGDLIDSILRYSEIGQVVNPKQNVDVSILLAEIICEIGLPNNVEISIENKLPTLYCERVRLKQVFQNLLTNAIKYMDKPKGRIRIGCIEENGFWKFSVADNGPGIKEAYFEKIFEIFQTLAPKDQVESTGVGLTIVKKIVELYGGKVWLTSKLGEGSTFFFTLPTQQMGD
jgi:PAS domain S-box-containing protein